MKTSAGRLRYLLFIPQGYAETSAPWPLIVYLHGRSRRGHHVDRLRRFSLPAVLDHKPDFPFVVASPQCPSGRTWFDMPAVSDLVRALVRGANVDETRIYLTGHSMGGSGVWYVAQKNPDVFAAIAPVSAGKVPQEWADRLRSMPVWIVHGTQDRQAPVAYAEEMASALERRGNPPKVTLLRGEGHDILHVYEEPALFDWFLLHRRPRLSEILDDASDPSGRNPR